MPTAVAPYTRRGIAVDSKAVEVVCDLLNRTLSEIPSVFGRLAYFCYLRDPHVGLYRHYILTEVIGEHEAQIQLREAHVAAFEQWLILSATRRQADLERYLSKVEDDKKAVIDTWVRQNTEQGLIPSTATSLEKSRFRTSIQVLTKAVRASKALR